MIIIQSTIFRVVLYPIVHETIVRYKGENVKKILRIPLMNSEIRNVISFSNSIPVLASVKIKKAMVTIIHKGLLKVKKLFFAGGEGHEYAEHYAE